MRVLRILTLIGFVAISIGMAIRFWIDGLPSVEPFQGVLQVPERARQVVTASEQIGQPPASRRASRGPRSGASSVRFTIGLGRAPEASFAEGPGATRSGEAPAPPRVGPPPPSPQPPAPAPAPTPPPPVVPPPPSPTPAPPQPAAPSAPTAAPAAPPTPGPATAPTPKPKPPKPKPTPTPTPAPAPAPVPPPPPPPPPPSTPGEPSGDTKPGWGKGDKNHDHTGPPGAAESHGKP